MEELESAFPLQGSKAEDRMEYYQKLKIKYESLIFDRLLILALEKGEGVEFLNKPSCDSH